VRGFTRLLAMLLTVVLLAGIAGDLCAGWHPSADARMACCLDGACGMHGAALTVSTDGAGAHDVGIDQPTTPRPTQADADVCCASSETYTTAPPGAFALDLALEPVHGPTASLAPPVTVALYGVDHWPAPPGTSGVARHVLISVFLI
jgi:hypothetical protein